MNSHKYGGVRFDFACNLAGKIHFPTLAGPAGKIEVGTWLGQGACHRYSFWLAVDTAGVLPRQPSSLLGWGELGT